MARQWVLQNRLSIDRANAAPDEFDRRTTTEKWDAIIAAVDDLAEDADYLATFRASLPNSAGDAWVTTYRSERAGLLGRVAGVLAAPNVAVAYGALSEDDRRALNSYGMDASISGSVADLRRALELAEDGIENDLASLDENYEAIYLREREIAIQQELGPELFLVRDYNEVAARFQADQAERNILDDDRAAVEAAIVAAGGSDAVLEARRDDIDARLAVLNARMAVDEAQVESLGDQIRVRQRELSEISEAREQIAGAGSPGVTNSMAALAGRHIDLARTTLEMREWGLGLMRSVDRVPGGPARDDNPAASGNAPTPVETIKAAIGMYELDRSGEIVRDAAGDAIVSAEFVALGVTDPAAELGDVFAGNIRGDTLELFAERLIAWQADPARAGTLAPEVSGAIGLIESELYSLIAARRIIDQRHSTGPAIAAGADAAIETAQQIQNKLSQVAGLESAIQDALTAARSAGTDEARAVLGVLEQRQYAELLYLFDGYAIDPDTGELISDGVTHTGGGERLGDIRRLADRFRVNLEQERVAEIVSAYADAGRNFLIQLELNPATLPVEQAAFLSAYSAEIDGSTVVAAVTAIADDTDFRANLWSYVEGMSDRALFKSEIAAVLRTNPGNEAALKADVLSAVNALQTRIDDTLEVELGRADAIVHRDRDLDVSTSVGDLIAAYATRATAAQANLNPAIAGVSDALSVADATTAIQTAIAALGTAPGEQAAAYADITRELGEVLSASAAADAASLKAEVLAALGGYSDPAAADTLTLEGELYLREMRAAIAISDNADTYDAADYPEELREFVLVRGYSLAEERYADYLALKNSSLAEEQEAAVLDLRGLTGDFARRILLNDFANYRAGNDVATKIAAARAGDEPAYTISAYLSEYLSEAGTDGSLLPRGGADIVEDLAVREYQRIAAAQTARGGGIAAHAQLGATSRARIWTATLPPRWTSGGWPAR